MSLDPVLLSVIANRMDGIVREMTNTLLRAARSAVISSARDFSCCLVTGNDELLSSAEGLPVHVFGCHIQTAGEGGEAPPVDPRVEGQERHEVPPGLGRLVPLHPVERGSQFPAGRRPSLAAGGHNHCRIFS